ncbi:MAG: hypothetical protein IJ745_04815 [Bacteroidales bacterium]|nr:hypothetical protein [Bacteroidales bacterium]
MKNIFKFMGIALMACSLTLVACSKDDDDNTTDPDTPVNPNPNPGQSVFKLTWDGSEPTLGFTNTKSNGSITLIEAARALNGDNVEYPYFCTWYGVTTTNQLYLTHLIQMQDGSLLSEYDDNAYASIVVIDGYVEIGGDSYPDYHYDYVKNSTIFGAWDANTYTVDNADMYIEYYELETYISAVQYQMGVADVQSVDDLTDDDWNAIWNNVPDTELNIKLSNFQFTAATSQE